MTILLKATVQTKYELVVLTKPMFAHFSTAVCDNEGRKCALLDDFQDCWVEYDSLSDPPTNWFFGAYQQKGEAAETFSDFEIRFARTSVDCHQSKDYHTFVSKTRRTTDKVVLRDHSY